MSETNDSESNGPVADLGAKQGSQEAAKVVPTNNLSQQSSYNQSPSGQQIPHQQQYPQAQHYQPQTQQPNFVGPRPVLRRTDSRSSLAYRQPVPPTYQNQPPVPGVQPGVVRQPPPTQPRPPLQGSNYFGQRPLPNPGPRYPNPPSQQQPAPIRYSQYDNQALPESPFRRAVNSVTESHIRPQRPAVQPGPRPPGIYPQKPLSTAPIQQPQPIVGSNIDQASKKNHILDNLDINASLSAGTEKNDSKIEAKSDMSKVPKIQNSYQAKSSVDLIAGNTTEKLQKYDDIRSSSSLGFAQDSEKDFDTAALNGKSSSREEITERPESRGGLLSRDHSTHSSMQKIDEDDDDAVITPSRTAYATGNIRSEKSSKSNSSDNVSQKSLDIGDVQKQTNLVTPAHSDKTELKKSPDIKKSPTASTRNSTDNISLKSLDVETSRQMKTPSPQPPELPDAKKSSPSPVPEAIVKPEALVKPTSLTIQEKVTPKPSSATGKPPPSPRADSAVDDKDKRRKAQSPKPHDRPPMATSPMPTKDVKNVKKSPRAESRNAVSRRRTLSGRSRQSEGDNDSGVDESTQGNDRSFNGEQSSPRKTPTKASKLPASKCKTPVKMLQSPKSPDSAKCVSPSPDKKKVPMNKVLVGAAPSPNIKTVKSKIGSLENTSYKPGGGKVKVENRKIDFSKVQPKIAAKNDTYQPSGGDKKSRTVNSAVWASGSEVKSPKTPEIQQQKLQWNAKSKIGSLENATYKPGGGDKKIESVKLDFKDKAKPKIGSKDNMKHVPGGGDVKSVEEELPEDIENRKLDISAQSKVGSLDNVKHKPGGGEIKIFDDKDYLKQRASGEHSSVLSGSQDEDESDAIITTKKRSNGIRPPTTLNISSASPKRRVRYMDMDGPRSLIGDSPQPKSIDHQRPMSACSSYTRKRNRMIRVPIAITDRPPWRY